MTKTEMREQLQRSYIIELEETVVLLADLLQEDDEWREAIADDGEGVVITLARTNVAARAALKKEGQSA